MGRPFLLILTFALGAAGSHFIPLWTFVPEPPSRPHFSSTPEPLLRKNEKGRQTLVSNALVEFADHESGALLVSLSPTYPALGSEKQYVWFDMTDAELADITYTRDVGAIVSQSSEPIDPLAPLRKGDRVSITIFHDAETAHLKAEKIARLFSTATP